jgi:glutamate dehydrogenase (NAD(P)+)
MYHGFAPGDATGRPLHVFGTGGRVEPPGRGVAHIAAAVLADRGRRPAGAKVAIQGFGKVGSHAARTLAEWGAKVVAVGDHLGGAARDDGLDVDALLEWAREHQTVRGFPGGDAIDGKLVLTWPCDVLIPAAIEDVLTADNAADVRAEIVVEGANAPTTPEADRILRQRGIEVVPDILANAGGVTVSYFEWAQNIQQYRWNLERVRTELEKTMASAYAGVRAMATERRTDLRTAAFAVALRRVGRATVSRSQLRRRIEF